MPLEVARAVAQTWQVRAMGRFRKHSERGKREQGSEQRLISLRPSDFRLGSRRPASLGTVHVAPTARRVSRPSMPLHHRPSPPTVSVHVSAASCERVARGGSHHTFGSMVQVPTWAVTCPRPAPGSDMMVEGLGESSILLPAAIVVENRACERVSARVARVAFSEESVAQSSRGRPVGIPLSARRE